MLLVPTVLRGNVPFATLPRRRVANTRPRGAAFPGSTQSVSWTISPAASRGEFRVNLVSAAGSWYVNKQVLPVAGQTLYATQVTAGVPAAAGYRAAVYWRPAVGSGSWAATCKSAAFTVTP